MDVGDKVKDMLDGHIHTITRIDDNGVIHTDRVAGVSHHFGEDEIGTKFVIVQ